jgi:hypothetical protein
MSSLVGDLVSGLFSYNRENYKYDRELRQWMEYELVDMRLRQAHLWRSDIRNIVEITLTKMEAYLLVIALELGCCVTALCKGRVPPGSPEWLAASHTLSLTGAFIYLFMALWLGLHAYVCAQAFKVRILTHFNRLPIPKWQTIEAGRTYESSFEKQTPRQMFRVPFAMGTQEGVAGRSCTRQAQDSTQPPQPALPQVLQSGGQGRSVRWDASSVAGADATEGGTRPEIVDPWGLERRGDDFPELAADVNEKAESQKHVLRCRHAAQAYETYDAFCRISMSTGTCSFATFLCYYCLTYVLTENASPVAAWGGMCAYMAIAVALLRLDMKLQSYELFFASFLMIAPTWLGGAITFMTSKEGDLSHAVSYAVPLIPFLHCLWYVYYISRFQIQELESGAVLPAAFHPVLYLDAFGWSRLPKARREARTRASPLVRQTSAFQSFQRLVTPSFLQAQAKELPAMLVLDPSKPSRPEDTSTKQENTNALPNETVSFKPSTFAVTAEEADTECIGEKTAGITPWLTYRMTTVVIAGLWFSAGIVSIVGVLENTNSSWSMMPNLEALQVSGKIQTKFASVLTRPHGLSCDPRAETFVTSGLNADGRESLLHAQLSSSGLQFESMSNCVGTADVEDVMLHQGVALVLPRQGDSVASCRLSNSSSGNVPSVAAGLGDIRLHEDADKLNGVFAQTDAIKSMALPVHRNWLDDRGAARLGSSPFEEDLSDYPEEISSVATIPCSAARNQHCLVIGTTARRVVQLAAKQLSPSAGRVWVPQRVFSNDLGEVPVAGAFALIGKQHLAVLLQKQGILRVLDLHNGGRHAQDLKLPQERTWAAVCAGESSIYTMEHGDDPSLWRLSLPASLAQAKEV